MPENHETWHGVMSWYYHAVVKKCVCPRGTSFGISFLQTGASLKKARGSERERATFVCIIQILELFRVRLFFFIH